MSRIISISLSIIFAIIFHKITFGQSSDQKLPRLEISEVRVSPGFMIFSISENTQNSLSVFRKLAPESEILDQDLNDFKNSYFWNVSGSGLFSASLGLRFNKEDGTQAHNPTLRLGFSFYQGQALNANLNKETRTAYDTLVSGQTGETIIRDSVSYRSINMNYRTTQLHFDASLIWRTNFDSHWMVFGGVGIEAGGSFNNRISIVEEQNGYGHYDYRNYRDNVINEERFAGKSGFAGSIYLPMGVDLRLGNKGFWGAISFTNEFRPGLTLTNIPELGNYISPSLAVTFGLKVTV